MKDKSWQEIILDLNKEEKPKEASLDKTNETEES